MSDVLTTLRTERNRVAAEVNAGEKELARIDKAIAIFANGNGNRDVYAHNAALARAALAKQLAENGGTLAGHVHEAIGTFAHPVRSHEVARLMRVKYADLRGQRGVDRRVSHALASLAKQGKVQRISRGVYQAVGQ